QLPFPASRDSSSFGDEDVQGVGANTPWEAAYDALGRRLWSRSGTIQRQFYWDGDRLAAELLPSGGLRIYQYAGPDALVPLGFVDYANADAEHATGRSYHVFSNPVGMPLVIEDENGKVVWYAERIDPYGDIRVRGGAEVEYNLRWPGHYFDPETRLQYNRYRYYDPALGRYLQSDPIGYQGSPVNLYAYCPNPLIQVDLLGLDHPGKTAKSNKEGGDHDGMEGTAPPKLRGVSNEQIALAASPGTSRARIAARKLVAKRFYKQHGKIWDPELNGGSGGMRNPSAAEARAQLKGIDYSKPVSIGPPPPTPARLEQWQRPGGRQGQFYADPGTSPGALGIHDKAADATGSQVPKVAKPYEMNQDGQPYMQSVASPIKDTWSVPGQRHYAEGGATQYYVPNVSSAAPAP
ncbi:MAG TPA: RHS repeat-associated core domain-containing protein, partial [Polyangiaceae bacterium]|nr:RHS repeat-associated core domain-containing protein [Polyangiaceae bacterium]